MKPVEITVEEAIAAATEAAWERPPRDEDTTCGHPGCTDHPGKGDMMIDCQSGFGMDIPLESVIETIRTSQRRAWVDGFIGHDMGVITKDGRKHFYEARRPAELTEATR